MPNDVQVEMPPVTFNPREAFELALREAKVYAASSLVPAAYQDNLANCLIALNMARRIGADPLQTMQNLYVVQGRPAWSAQFLIAAFNQCGRFTSMRFEWRGEEGSKDWACRAWATERKTNERIEGPWVTWKMVEAEGWSKKSGSKWQTIPGLMFHYRAAAFFVRTHAPEIAMGLQTVEEVGDVIDVTPMQEPVSAIEAAKEKLRSVAKVPESKAEPSGESITYAQFMDKLNACKTQDECDIVEGFLPAIENEQIRAEADSELRKRRKELTAAA